MNLGDYGSESGCRWSMDHHSFVSSLKEGMLFFISLLSVLHYFYFFTFCFVFKGALCISSLYFLLTTHFKLPKKRDQGQCSTTKGCKWVSTFCTSRLVHSSFYICEIVKKWGSFGNCSAYFITCCMLPLFKSWLFDYS
jgi:hypothetical protein